MKDITVGYLSNREDWFAMGKVHVVIVPTARKRGYAVF